MVTFHGCRCDACAGRRAGCRVPDEEHHRPGWQLAVDMLDELATVGLWPAVLVADTGYGANADFRHALEDRGLPGQGRMTAHTETAEPYEPPYGGLGPRPLPRYRTRRSACVNSTGRGSPLPLSPVPPASPRGTSSTEPWNSTWAAKTSRARHARGRPQRR
ncbi:transposase [Streptomyces sp. DT203]|uniref:transposase n=1 Tax=Streptomyces sp. DT203 TaxID=3393424 RepID=UPI003CEF351F